MSKSGKISKFQDISSNTHFMPIQTDKAIVQSNPNVTDNETSQILALLRTKLDQGTKEDIDSCILLLSKDNDVAENLLSLLVTEDTMEVVISDTLAILNIIVGVNPGNENKLLILTGKLLELNIHEVLMTILDRFAVLTTLKTASNTILLIGNLCVGNRSFLAKFMKAGVLRSFIEVLELKEDKWKWRKSSSFCEKTYEEVIDIVLMISWASFLMVREVNDDHLLCSILDESQQELAVNVFADCFRTAVKLKDKFCEKNILDDRFLREIILNSLNGVETLNTASLDNVHLAVKEKLFHGALDLACLPLFPSQNDSNDLIVLVALRVILSVLLSRIPVYSKILMTHNSHHFPTLFGSIIQHFSGCDAINIVILQILEVITCERNLVGLAICHVLPFLVSFLQTDMVMCTVEGNGSQTGPLNDKLCTVILTAKILHNIYLFGKKEDKSSLSAYNIPEILRGMISKLGELEILFKFELKDEDLTTRLEELIELIEETISLL